MVSFADILVRAHSSEATALVLVLSWVAACDGALSAGELKRLKSVAAAGDGENDLTSLIEIARRGDLGDFQLACEVVGAAELNNRQQMLRTVVDFALEDGVLTSGEGHVVRFLADVLSHSPSDLDALFQEITGELFPSPADPSSIEWWDSRERRARERVKHSESQSDWHTRESQEAKPSSLGRLRDLAALGLDEIASTQDIRDAYRRMAKMHHPDRYTSLGPEAVRDAEASFRRIQGAYERLVDA